jgi:D-2-hydroxyglutarate dehydrogenase
VQVAFLRCPGFDQVQQVLAAAKAQLGEILSACEFLDTQSLDLVTSHLPGVTDPLASGSSSSSSGGSSPGTMYMVVETHGSNAEHDAEKLSRFLEVGRMSTTMWSLGTRTLSLRQIC